MTVVLYTLGVSFGLAFVLGILLGFFRKVFHVETDPLESEIREALPGANCGACGYPGCDGFAAAVASGAAAVTGCVVGGAETAAKLAALMGADASAAVRKVAVLACQGTKDLAPAKGMYNGVKTCRAVKLSCGGLKFCDWGCIGFGDCETVCKFDAIHVGEDGLPHVDYSKCTGCGMCVAECPQKILTEHPRDRKGAAALCANRSEVKGSVIKDCKTGCIKCGKCERACPEKALKLVNGIPEIDYSLCTSCGECVRGCPTHVLKLLENVTARG